MNKCAGAFESATSGKSGQKAIVEEISLRHQLDSVPDAADDAIANEAGTGTVHGIHSVIQPQDNVSKVAIHGPDIDPFPTLDYSSKTCRKETNDPIKVVNNESTHAEKLAVNPSKYNEKKTLTKV